MEISIYLNGPYDAIHRMEQEIATWSDLDVSIKRTTKQFFRQLQHPALRPQIVVLMISGIQELKEFSEFRALMQNIYIILILPNQDSSLLALGLDLYPRFLTVVDNDFKEITAVIRKLITRCRVLDNRHGTSNFDSQGGTQHG